jgi:hypothetical protein
MSAPAGDFASGSSGSIVVFILLSSNFIGCFFEDSVQHVQGAGVNETLTEVGMMAVHNYYGRRRWLTARVTGWWAGRDNASLPKLTSSHENCLKTHRVPPPAPAYFAGDRVRALLGVLYCTLYLTNPSLFPSCKSLRG